ncbi:MAG: helix-turn-helix domain-containing protein [Bdellovibrionales bacterium]
MPTGKQIRAARVLAGWDIKDLAPRAGLSVTAVQNIETGAIPKSATNDRIIKAFSDVGIEFLDHQGVRFKPQGVDMLIGSKGLQQFFDGVCEHARKHGGEIVQFGVDEEQFLEHLGKEFSASYVKRMQEIAEKRQDLKVKAIICEGATEALAPDYNEYRWISRDIFQAVPFYIYGKTLAVMDFQTDPSPTIVLLKFDAITNAYRKQFNAFWKIAKKTPN